MRQIVGILFFICCNNSRDSNVWQMLFDEIIVFLNEIFNKSLFDFSSQSKEDWIRSDCFLLVVDFYISK